MYGQPHIKTNFICIIFNTTGNSLNLFALASGSYSESFCRVCVLAYGNTNTANNVGHLCFLLIFRFINCVVNVSIRKNGMACEVQSKTSPWRNWGQKHRVKWSRYRPSEAQRVGRCIDLLFHDRDTRRGWVVSSTPRPHFTPGKVLVPILQEAGWAPGLVWMGGKSHPHRDLIPDCPARSQSLYWLSYLAHQKHRGL